MNTGILRWAREEFGGTALGDVRRTRRLLTMVAAAARRPSGRVSVVFDRAPEREGAYDFLESEHVKAEALAASVFRATVSRSQGHEYVFVMVDGSSLSLSDENGAKGLGSVGSPNRAVTGLMVMNALAVAPDGVPLGLVDQIFWNREEAETGLTPTERTNRNQRRPFEEKETSYQVDAAKNAQSRLDVAGVKAWVVIDRAGDNRDVLLELHRLGCLFTVRARWNRALWKSEQHSVHQALDSQASLGSFEVKVGRSGRRPARTAIVDVRAAQVTLHFKGRGIREHEGLRLYAVRVREARKGKDALDWLLYTNVPVFTAEHARCILESYQSRWRVEEFHRTWKQGECNVEDAQLRSVEAITKWATILAAVATRIERVKYLSRNTPDVPAAIEFAAEEIEALKLDQRRRQRRRRRLPEMPTISQATRWAAELGGWIGDQNGPPGSITLARGLERLSYLVEGIALARQRKRGGSSSDYPT